MTQQLRDPFFWRGKEYNFLGATDIYSLFNPEGYGLTPEALSSACWKGFVVQFSVRDEQLYLDCLWVNCEDGHYPPIGQVRAEPSDENGVYAGFHVYHNLGIPLNYTGTITIGRELMGRFEGRAFIGPHSYEEVYELQISQGKLVQFKDTSGTYVGF